MLWPKWPLAALCSVAKVESPFAYGIWHPEGFNFRALPCMHGLAGVKSAEACAAQQVVPILASPGRSMAARPAPLLYCPQQAYVWPCRLSPAHSPRRAIRRCQCGLLACANP